MDKTDWLIELGVFEGTFPWLLTLRGEILWAESGNHLKSWGRVPCSKQSTGIATRMKRKTRTLWGPAICKAEAFFKDLKCKKQLSAEWNKRRSARTCTGEQQKPAGWSERPRMSHCTEGRLETSSQGSLCVHSTLYITISWRTPLFHYFNSFT